MGGGGDGEGEGGSRSQNIAMLGLEVKCHMKMELVTCFIFASFSVRRFPFNWPVTITAFSPWARLIFLTSLGDKL